MVIAGSLLIHAPLKQNVRMIIELLVSYFVLKIHRKSQFLEIYLQKASFNQNPYQGIMGVSGRVYFHYLS
jgi:hypothetical protein